MIEVLFGESESASMKVAKNTIIKGKTDEVICLGFMLDIGDIQEDIGSPYRRKLIYDMYHQQQWEEDPETDAELSELTDVYMMELQRLKEYLQKGESIRIWYSNAPYSMCGFYHLCSILSEYNNQIRVVKLPEHIIRRNVIISYQNLGEVPAEEFADLSQYEKELSKEEIRMYHSLWDELRIDNAPLRTVITGKIIGVSEDFYDFLIWKRFPQKPIEQGRLIGDILLTYPISIGDWWYAKRINYLIEQKKIKIIKDSKNSYERLICRV